MASLSSFSLEGKRWSSFTLVNPDPSFHFNVDPDPTFYFDADPDPAPHQSDVNLRPLVYRPSLASFWASCLCCEHTRPSMAPFWSGFLLWSWCGSGYGFSKICDSIWKGSGSATQFFLSLQYNTVFIVHSYAKNEWMNKWMNELFIDFFRHWIPPF